MDRVVIRRHELSDAEWELPAPLMPSARQRPASRGGPHGHQRDRFRRYALDDVFTRTLQQVQVQADAAGDIDWLVQIDSTIIRAHQHAATGRKGGTGRTNQTITPSAGPEED